MNFANKGVAVSDDVKLTVIIGLVVVLLFSLLIGGILANRWIVSQDPREVTGFTVSIQVPPGFTCWVLEDGLDATVAVFACER